LSERIRFARTTLDHRSLTKKQSLVLPAAWKSKSRRAGTQSKGRLGARFDGPVKNRLAGALENCENAAFRRIS
jgi:hypothetical protein